jgi:hypothetical protein
MSGGYPVIRTFAFASLFALAAVPALADTLYSEGTSSLSLSRNQGETNCWVETDCPSGEVCHAAVFIEGEPARQLADLLRARVEKDPTFADWGLDIYVSSNDGLYCDLTEPESPRCTFNVNTQTAELEGPLSCE